MYMQDWNLKKMLNDFTYTLVSPHNEAGKFQNSCMHQLDFQTNEYEVCMQDMSVAVNAWNNVRDGANGITIGGSMSFQVYVQEGVYFNYEDLIKAFNDSLK